MERGSMTAPDPERECVLAKITQYRCKKGDYIVCTPIERLFKRCPGVPAVEMVPVDGTYVDIKSLNNLVETSEPGHPYHKTIHR
ncbi:hypothetical protein IWW55_001845 [Coemansia sp. RSA 2706]|nr:hypothetical protein IWW55_001845 [Coemansia sp. RSA 2706]KAJ2310467.1 hypothetical protein IWW54_003175 [Coemansia sp. RSA 2705]KAJ2317865.1 hypothetical protein IWW52_002887 [Coemansia sp. RSA 2704]KAJ2327629.1 hypothetical protein IWW51_001643 [Coemansia sp. RSA 2702]KAJ2732865.1 hypothetical protein H4R23_002746 [Coemansia sp. Cherry 401B]